MSTVVPSGKVEIFAVEEILHGAQFNFLGQCFGRSVRVW